MRQQLMLTAYFVWALVVSLATFFIAVIPLTVIGLVAVPLALLSPNDSQKAATEITNGIDVWWLRTLKPWASLWDNPYDGFLGDSKFRWAGRDMPFGWKNTYYRAQCWWGALRNPLHRFKSFVITCDIRRCTFTHLLGQDFVRDRPDSTGFQFLTCVRDDGKRYFRIYWVWQWPRPFLGADRAVIVELGHEFRRDHWHQDYTGADYKNLKGFAFLIHPCKAI
jgi:hypothetical protein